MLLRSVHLYFGLFAKSRKWKITKKMASFGDTHISRDDTEDTVIERCKSPSKKKLKLFLRDSRAWNPAKKCRLSGSGGDRQKIFVSDQSDKC